MKDCHGNRLHASIQHRKVLRRVARFTPSNRPSGMAFISARQRVQIIRQLSDERLIRLDRTEIGLLQKAEQALANL